MSRKKTEKVDEVVEIKEEEKTEEAVVEEETKAPEVDEETTETPVEEPVKVDEEIDPRIRAMMSLNSKSKISEKDKQTKIYSAMANIQVVRS